MDGFNVERGFELKYVMRGFVVLTYDRIMCFSLQMRQKSEEVKKDTTSES